MEQLVKEKLELLNEIEKSAKGSEYIKELSDLAMMQLELEQYDEAEKNFLTCLRHFTNFRDSIGKASVLAILGVLFFKKSDYQKSLEYYHKAYDINKELNQAQEQIMCLKGIGLNYMKLNQLEVACKTFLECSEICSIHEDIYNLLDCLGNLIQINESQEKWDLVYDLYKKSLKAFKELKDNQGIIVSYFNLGILKRKNSQYDNALRYFKKGTNIAIEANFAELIIKGLGYVGEILFYLGKMKDAKNEFVKALHLAEQIDAKNAIVQIKVVLKSFGLNDENIEKELRDYREHRK